MQLTIVVMAYDEVVTVASTVQEIRETCDTLGCDYEILIVDDGSRDGTGDVADRLAEEYPVVRVVHHATNLGLGGVYRTAFKEARGQRVTFQPADGQVPARTIANMYVAADSYDIVLGFVPNRNCSYLARLLSLGERLLYRILFGKIPRFQGVLMFHRRLLDGMVLKSEGRGWAILWEFILRASRAGCSYTNVATEVRLRTAGTSKVHTPRVIASNLVQVISLHWLLKD